MRVHFCMPCEHFLKLITEDIIINDLMRHLVRNHFTRLQIDPAHLIVEEPHIIEVMPVERYPQTVCLAPVPRKPHPQSVPITDKILS